MDVYRIVKPDGTFFSLGRFFTTRPARPFYYRRLEEAKKMILRRRKARPSWDPRAHETWRDASIQQVEITERIVGEIEVE